MTENTLLQQAIAAARAGHQLTARDLFLEVVKSEPKNEVAWLWLTGLLDEFDDCIHACEKVLEINPENARARQYLAQLQAEKQRVMEKGPPREEEQLGQVRELVKANQSDHALQLLRSLTQNGKADADAWRLMAELSPQLDEQIHALECLLLLEPKDVQAQQGLQRLRHFQQNPLDLAAMYEEKGEIDKAIAIYSSAAASLTSRRDWDRVYKKIVSLENLRQEKIAHISADLSIARLTGGPALLYLLLMLIQVGINPFSHPQPLLWLGFLAVLAGGFMVALASVRSHHRLWDIIFGEAGSSESPAARFVIAAAGWTLILLPHLMLFGAAFSQLSHFTP